MVLCFAAHRLKTTDNTRAMVMEECGIGWWFAKACHSHVNMCYAACTYHADVRPTVCLGNVVT